jgi:hypothetical protein
MEITGNIIQLLSLQTGTGKNGTWRKQEYILETSDKIPRKVCFSLWGDKIDQFPLAEGDEAEIMFDLESREYNGRWYTEVKAWKCVRKGGTEQSKPVLPDPPGEVDSEDPIDVMPF